MPFLGSLDIANLTCQFCGVKRIASVNEVSRNNNEISVAYDLLRKPELRRNAWRFAIKKAILRPVDVGTLLLNPEPWSASTTYLLGALVADANGIIWQSSVTSNVGNDPASTAAWEEYFGPMTVAAYSSGTVYYTGELVYKSTATAGSFVIYLSLQNSNSDAPDVATAYDPTIQYGLDDVVSHSGLQWRSLIPVNLGTTPATAPTAYDPNAIYASGASVTGPDGYIYTSLQNSNTGRLPSNNPTWWSNTLVPAAWSSVPTLYASSQKWLPIFASLKPLGLMYPAGCGPSSQNGSRNVFHLPSGWLRDAPQDPKAGSWSFLGAPSGSAYNDWLLEGDYLISMDTLIILRFIADVTDVRRMDDMFCKGLAASIGMMVCEPLTQSTSKLQSIAAQYKEAMGDARTVNAIETGSEEPPVDDWITCRY